MLLNVVLVYDHGRKLSEVELRAADCVVGDVRTQTIHVNGKDVLQVVCMGQTTDNLPPLIKPQLTEIQSAETNQIAVLQRVTTETRLK
jgi:hypothetical protein